MPYDFDTLIQDTTHPKPKEPERWRNRYRAITQIKCAQTGEIILAPSIFYGTEDHSSAEAAVAAFEDSRVFNENKAANGKFGINYLYLGPERQG